MFGTNRRTRIVRTLGAAAVVGFASQALAGLAFSFSGGFNAAVGTQTSTVGNDGLFFSVDAPITVSTLGYYHDGAAHRNAVGLFRVSDGALLASVNVTTTSNPLPPGSFDMASIAPVNLVPNTQYAVVGLMAPGQVAQYITHAVSGNAGAAPGINFLGYKYNYDSSLSLPTLSYGDAYVGPNFGFTAVPGSGTASVIGVGALFVLRRRRS